MFLVTDIRKSTGGVVDFTTEQTRARSVVFMREVSNRSNIRARIVRDLFFAMQLRLFAFVLDLANAVSLQQPREADPSAGEVRK